jgi:hypothetical protein
MMAVSLGNRAGLAFVSPIGAIRAAWLNRKLKAESMLVPMYHKKARLPGLTPRSPHERIPTALGWQIVPPMVTDLASPRLK